MPNCRKPGARRNRRSSAWRRRGQRQRDRSRRSVAALTRVAGPASARCLRGAGAGRRRSPRGRAFAVTGAFFFGAACFATVRCSCTDAAGLRGGRRGGGVRTMPQLIRRAAGAACAGCPHGPQKANSTPPCTSSGMPTRMPRVRSTIWSRSSRFLAVTNSVASKRRIGWLAARLNIVDDLMRPI